MVTRFIVFVLALVGFAVSAALLLREAAQAGSATVVWNSPGWWTDTVRDGAWSEAGAAGLALLAVAVVLVLLGLRLFVSPPRDAARRRLDLGERYAEVSVPLEVLETMVATSLADALKPARVGRVRVTRRDERLVTRARFAAAAADLVGLHARVHAIARHDLETATALETGDTVVEVDRLIAEGEPS